MVGQATSRFTAATGAQVKVEWQQWVELHHQAGLDLRRQHRHPGRGRAGQHPDRLVHRGRRLQRPDLGDKGTFENSSTWLQGLAESGTSPDGKLYAVPYYAGSRVVIYRKELWTKAGVTTRRPPWTSLRRPGQGQGGQSSDPNFSAFYMPGKYWYAAMSFVYGAGGKIAEKSGGQWAGEAGSPQAQTGLPSGQAGHEVFGRRRHQGRVRPGRHLRPGPQGRHPAATAGRSAHPRPEDRETRAGPGSGHLPAAGQRGAAPDAVVPRRLRPGRPRQGRATPTWAQWIKDYTDTASPTALAKFAIPNTTSLLNV